MSGMSGGTVRRMPDLRPELKRQMRAQGLTAPAAPAAPLAPPAPPVQKITRPEFIEVEERQAPPAFIVPKMAPKALSEPPKPSVGRNHVWRCQFADLEVFGDLGEVLLRQRFPEMDLRALRSWAKQAVSDRACLFLRGEESFAFFLHTISIWEPRGILREVFIVPDDINTEHRIEFYKFAIRWKRQVRAKRLEINPPEEISYEIVGLGLREVEYSPLVFEED